MLSLSDETCATIVNAATRTIAFSVTGIGFNHLIRTFTYKSCGNPCKYYNCNDVESVLLCSTFISMSILSIMQ